MPVTIKKCDYRRLFGDRDLEGGEEFEMFGRGSTDARISLSAYRGTVLLNPAQQL